MTLSRLYRVFFVAAVFGIAASGCNRTPSAPPPMTPETQAAIQAEDREVFDAERAQR